MEEQCRCGGELEQIAETDMAYRTNETYKTAYLECSKCKSLYEYRQTRSLTTPASHTNLQPYRGALRSEEFAENAREHLGEISSYDEIRILMRRKSW